MNVLIAMETSGNIRRAFQAKGHNAWSCDLLPADDQSTYHFQCDVFQLLADQRYKWDMMIAHPNCQYLCGSGLHWNGRRPGRAQLTEAALDDVRKLMAADIDKICIENPIGCISSRIRKPDQIVQPYTFGENASKKTCLWLKNLPKLQPTVHVPGRWSCNKHVWDQQLGPKCPTCGKDSTRLVWANQTPSGQNKLGPSPERWKLRSETYPGIAEAMAQQWGQ